MQLQEYDPELFGKALPCLSAIGCALPPDYSLSSGMDDEAMKHVEGDSGGPYNPQPIETHQYVYFKHFQHDWLTYYHY
jgi:ryanodine receptor 2